MGYIFEEKFYISDVLTIKKAMYEAIRRHSSFNAFQRSLVKTGFSYRRVEMLEDWHRASGAALSHSWGASEKALEWYDKIFKPLQISRGESVSQTHKFLRSIEKGYFVSDEDFQDSLKYEEQMIEFFEVDYI